MCTALSYKSKNHYFGRNLDVERSYNESIVITPRNFGFDFRFANPMNTHHAIIGMAAVFDNYPLYFDAVNEKGLSIAGLNFPNNAVYGEYVSEKENIAPFELIPYILGSCENIADVKSKLNKINIIHCNFNDNLPSTPLHWLIADRERAITLENTKDGMRIFDNPFGVLTNNPTFDFHLQNINSYMHLHEGANENRLFPALPIENYSLGLGALGLPGDFSSASRFVKAVFVKQKSVCGGSEKESVGQFFHILQSVAMPMGCVLMPNGEYEYTRCSCCINTDTQTYYYNTYHDQTVRKEELNSVDLNGNKLTVFQIEQ